MEPLNLKLYDLKEVGNDYIVLSGNDDDVRITFEDWSRGRKAPTIPRGLRKSRLSSSKVFAIKSVWKLPLPVERAAQTHYLFGPHCRYGYPVHLPSGGYHRQQEGSLATESCQRLQPQNVQDPAGKS